MEIEVAIQKDDSALVQKLKNVRRVVFTENMVIVHRKGNLISVPIVIGAKEEIAVVILRKDPDREIPTGGLGKTQITK